MALRDVIFDSIFPSMEKIFRAAVHNWRRRLTNMRDVLVLLDSLRARVDVHDPTALLAAFSKEPVASQALGVEAIFAALFLTVEHPGSADANRALDRMWSL